jgi:hypothetical protein
MCCVVPDDSTTSWFAEEQLPPELQWRLRLLVSIDLVGSTALKQRSAMAVGDLEPWLPWFLAFYDGFPAFLTSTYRRLSESLIAPSPPEPPVLWKFNGDEVLMHATLVDYRQVLAHVMAVRDAVCHWRDQWAEGLGAGPHAADEHRKRRFPLDVKATVWVAGFPVTNAIVGDDPARPTDFIGPQVDLGFRIAQLATRTRIILDPAVAHMVAEAMVAGGRSGCQLVYLGRHRLEGILEESPYPVFAVQAPHAMTDAETALGLPDRRLEAPVEPEAVMRFCQEFHRDTTGVLRPFIWQDAGGKFALDAAEHELLDKRRAGLIDKWVKQGYVPPNADEASGGAGCEVDEQLDGTGGDAAA